MSLVAAKGALALAGRLWWLAPIAGLGIALLFSRGDASRLKFALKAEQAAHVATVANYRAAQAVAAKNDARAFTATKIQQDKITSEIRNDYLQKIAKLRARLAVASASNSAARRERMRLAPETGAVAGRGENSPMSRIPAAAERIDAASGNTGLSAEQRLIATEQAIQLSALIQWVQWQSRVAEQFEQGDEQSDAGQ